jgi:polyisoprenoid-binding protein YceI
MKTLRYLAPLASIMVIGTAAAGSWTVATDSSTVGFTAEQQGGKFNGDFAEFSATIDFDTSAPADGKIVGVVETESVATRDYDRDAALTDVD